MGVRSVLGADPVILARNLVDSREDLNRIERQQSRRLMLGDNFESVIKRVIQRTFTDPTVRERVNSFASMARAENIFKRVCQEKARPIYIVPPVRMLDNEADQGRFNAIAEAGGLDCVMDSACLLSLAQNTSFVLEHYNQRLDRIVYQALPADAVRVLQDPDDPLRMLGILYDYEVLLPDGTTVAWRAYWDDEVRFVLNHNNQLAGPVAEHDLGRIPAVAIHSTPRWGSFWNVHSGDDLFESQCAVSMLTLLALRKLKARGFRQIVLQGDMLNFPKGQVWDEESGLQVPEGSSVQELGQEADAANYLEMIRALMNDVAANNGISRARLNQENSSSSSDVGLLEQRAEIVKFMRLAELELFDLTKQVSREFGDERTLSEGARMSIDFAELAQKVDPKADLEIWEMRQKAGVASVLDQIKADNPDIKTDQEAWDEFDRNLVILSQKVLRMRALNESPGATQEQPGQSPAANGALGPAVRDGKMTAGEALDASREGVRDDRTPPEGD